MKKFLSFSILSVLVLSLIAKAQPTSIVMASPRLELISWDPERKLNWKDYKADPDMESDAVASTATMLSISYHIKQNGFTYQIVSGFDPNKSWAFRRTSYILSHEQGHFDIAEIFARKLHKRMQEYKFDRKNYQKDLKKIYQEVVEEKEKMQNDYDEETRHSILRGRQAEWLKKIAAMLKEYEAYADYKDL